jgi:hypothetical protein
MSNLGKSSHSRLSSQLSRDQASTKLSSECSLKSLKVPFPERIEIICVHTVFLAPLLTSGTCHNFSIWYPSVSYEPPGPCQNVRLASGTGL